MRYVQQRHISYKCSPSFSYVCCVINVTVEISCYTLHRLFLNFPEDRLFFIPEQGLLYDDTVMCRHGENAMRRLEPFTRYKNAYVQLAVNFAR